MTQESLNLSPYVPSNGTETSGAAADSMRPHVARLEAYVLAAVSHAAEGLTCDEVEVRCALTHQTASARINGLMNKGLIKDVGRRKTRSGRNAAVWRAA